MPAIKVLDEFTANKIAAGEVVERPASVVKELIENSLDAGAEKIEIVIIDGGLSFIEITDNGCGMLEDDAKRAFLRHATSKIVTHNDLESVKTLGFRGEALPSIASVSQVRLKTRTLEAISGTLVEMSGGRLMACQPVGCPGGTTVSVSQLFFNTPARKKYMATPATEAGVVSDTVSRLALSRPGVSFRFTSNGRLIFQTPGTGNIIDALATIYGVENARAMLPVNEKRADITIIGYISNTSLNRSSRRNISIIINGRYIKNKNITQALVEGYQSLLPRGRYPVALLCVEMDPRSVDVNVHPAKLEVKVSGERLIAESVKRCVEQSLFLEQATINKPAWPNQIRVTPAPESKGSPDKQIIDPDRSYQELLLGDSEATPWTVSASLEEAARQPVKQSSHSMVSPSPPGFEVGQPKDKGCHCIINELPQGIMAAQTLGPQCQKAPPGEPLCQTSNPRASVLHEAAPGEKGYTYGDNIFNQLFTIGYLQPMYILAGGGNGLFIIDQHAAHERLLFEKFVALFSQGEQYSQALLVPVPVHLSPGDAAIALENKDFFKAMGFSIENFGGNSIILRGVPSDIAPGREEIFLLDMIDYIANYGRKQSRAELLRSLAARAACREAVKSGQNMPASACQELIKKLARARNPYTCPHGRPTIVNISAAELATRFKRT